MDISLFQALIFLFVAIPLRGSDVVKLELRVCVCVRVCVTL